MSHSMCVLFAKNVEPNCSDISKQIEILDIIMHLKQYLIMVSSYIIKGYDLKKKTIIPIGQREILWWEFFVDHL